MQQWIWLGLLSGLFAALVGVVGKRGVEQIDPMVATTLRAVVMALMLGATSLLLGRARSLPSVSRADVGWIALSGAAGAASWLCYFAALRTGPVMGTAALDRLSIVFTLVLAALFLKERLTLATALGGMLIAAGAVLVARGR